MWKLIVDLRQTIGMRYLLAALLFFISIASFAQGDAERITFSRFDKPKDLALLDTVKQMLFWGNYGKFISNEREVFVKGSKTKDFSAIKKLLNKLSSNGSDDISECFYPRHSINFYKGGKIVDYVLICFECEGIRFSDERWITNVKSDEKRIALMKQLKEYFRNEGLTETSR
jgi:hypothetical protein